MPVLILLFLSGCAMSEQDEIELGRKVHVQFEQEFGGRYGDADVQQYVNSVGMGMARYAGRPNLDWQFHVLNSDQINAFAVPGGYIYITRGLLFRLSNEAQLAGVLGHEAGHIEHRHSVKQIQRAQTVGIGATVIGIVASVFGYGGVGDLANVVGQLTLMKYGRGQEQEADYSGLEYMTQAGYDPRGIVQTMQVLQQAAGSGGPEWMSSHPNPGNRIEYLNDAIDKKYSSHVGTGRMGEEAFQQVVGQPVAMMRIDWSQPSMWCLTCRLKESQQKNRPSAAALSN